MASGCDNNSGGVNKFMQRIPDRGVVYTGPAIESLGICTNDRLDEVEAAILEKIVDYAVGEGISLPDVDVSSCVFLDSFSACCFKDKSLSGIMQGVLNAICSLHNTDIATSLLLSQIGANSNYTIVPGCLTIANNKIDTVLNKLISDYCAFSTKVTNIFGSLDNPVLNTTVINQVTDTVVNNLYNNIKGCLPGDVVKTGTGINTVLTIKGINPIGSMIFGQWDNSYFDNTGLGLASKGMCGYAVCNGVNGTPDMRGFSIGMATNIPSSLSLNTIVSPTTNNDADLATNIGDIKGEPKHRLTGNETGVASHTHGITQTPHGHAVGNFDRLLQHTGTFTVNSNDNNDSNGREPALNDSGIINPANANISINPNIAISAQSAHENRPATRYVNCIMRIA